jgi:hypothetical protein
MEIKKPKISFYMRRGYEQPYEFEIELFDDLSSKRIAKIILDEKQFFNAISGLGYVKCKKAEAYNFDTINKKMEYKELKVEIEEPDKKLAKRLIKHLCPKGWIPDMYFNSQDSFIYEKGKCYAVDTIRRWV